VVGYISEVTENDLTQNRFPGAGLGSIVGRAGVERIYDDTLRGQEGIRYIEVNARGRLVREEASTASLQPTAGRPLYTTIDLDLQKYIDSIWPTEYRGAMIAMTPKGEIRALYSAPTYDPNLFVGGISRADYRMLQGDSARPLLNRAINGRYPPASPFKLATAAMALKRGVIGLNSHMPIPCRGGMQFGNRYYKCWKKTGHGDLDLTGAVAASCDVYFYQVGLRLGLETMLEDGTSMGFGERSHIDLPSEQSPIYPASLAYFNKKYGPRGWTQGSTALNFSIGQGENTQTLINMVKFYQALAGDGQQVTPYIVTPKSAETHSLGLSEEQLAGLRRALIAVLEGGTASRSRRANLQVAGKTGTAQNPHGKDHGWFIAFAPADKPQIVIGGIMEFAEHGTTVAPYVVSAISRYVLGPDSVTTPKVVLSVPRDSAPRAVEFDSASGKARVVPTTEVPVEAPPPEASLPPEEP
jgi:penicillin-binding protein 2